MKAPAAKALGLLVAIPLIAESQPGLEWDAPSQVDDRVTHFELHCAPNPTPVEIDGAHFVGMVPASETSIDITGALTPGVVYDCVATAYSQTYSMRSGPSNTVVVDMADISPLQNLRIVVTVTVTVP